jgi:hypothetical protein
VTDTLFPDLADPEPPAPVERLSTDPKRTLRQHADLAAGRHPLTRGPVRQPAGETSGSCAYREMRNGGNRSYPKCVYLDGRTTRVAVFDHLMCCEWTVALGRRQRCCTPSCPPRPESGFPGRLTRRPQLTQRRIHLIEVGGHNLVHREDESPAGAASARMDTPSARTDANAQLRSRSA